VICDNAARVSSHAGVRDGSAGVVTGVVVTGVVTGVVTDEVSVGDGLPPGDSPAHEASSQVIVIAAVTSLVRRNRPLVWGQPNIESIPSNVVEMRT
jgi:hypothetical protein